MIPGLTVTGLLFLLGSDAVSAEEAKQRRSFFDPNDGWLDLSEFIGHPMGFIPMVVPITEPAIGYGGAFAPVFIRPGKSRDTGKAERPQITAVGGMMTQNGSDGLVAFNKSYWFEDRLETVVAGVSASVNLDFHGIGKNLSFGDDPMRYNLDAQGGMVQGRARVGNSVEADSAISFRNASACTWGWMWPSPRTGIRPFTSSSATPVTPHFKPAITS